MEEPIALILLTLFIIVTLPFYLVAIRACFPLFEQQVQIILQRSPGRSLIIGAVNVLFWGAAIAVLGALADGSGGILALPAIVLLAVVVLGLSIGLGSISQIIGENWLSERSRSRQGLGGGVALTLAIATPFLGWFLLFPLLATAGLGATFMNLLARLQRPPK